MRHRHTRGWDSYVGEVQRGQQVRGRGWPAHQAVAALLNVAADPATRSPARPAETGPWWDRPTEAQPVEPTDLSTFEVELDAVGGQRVQQQRAARAQLTAERHPLTRATVIRAAALLHSRGVG